MDFCVLIGKRTRELRRAKGMTQADLAEASGLARSYIAELETGRRNPRLPALEKLLVGLDVSPREFFCDEIFGITADVSASAK